MSCPPLRSLTRASIVALGLLAILPFAGRSYADEIILKAVNSFQEGTYFARNFEQFIKKVNDEGKGLVQINYVGGPKAIPTMEQGAALRNGVVDLANTSSSFTASVAPEALSINFATLPWGELRKNGALDYLNKVMQEKGLYYFARAADGIAYHVYLNKKIDKPDLTGLKLRIAPIYRDFFQKLGATVVQVPPGEVYTALERGVVDGYGWPIVGIFDLGWQEKTKYRLDPGFYTVEVGVQFNAKTWAKLTAQQKQYLEKQGAWLEALTADMPAKDAPADIKRQKEAGIQVIQLSAGDAKQFQQTALDAGWTMVTTASPTHGAKLRELMTAKK